MAFIMLIMIRFLSNAAVEYDIKQDLKRSVEKNLHHVSIEYGQLNISEDFLYQDDYIHFVIVRRNGKVWAGAYPEEIAEDLINYRARHSHSRSIICNDEKYYVRDMKIGRIEKIGKDGKYKARNLFVRGILRKEDAYSLYRTIEIVAYLSIIGIFLVIFLCEMLLTKKISKELQNMRETAENIGLDLDMSKRMEYTGRFQEIAVLAQANNRMLDRMEQVFLQQEQFNSDVSHELRTPVAVVMAECQSIKGKDKSKEELKEVLDVVYRQSLKINTIIKQLLHLSRLEQGREQIREEDIDLLEIVESICEEIQDKSEAEILINLNLQEVHTIGDIQLIMMVVDNLIRNALKFGPSNGPIDISTGEENGQIFVSVRDYGSGIPKEEQENIFKRFYKSDKSRNREGFGLGLALSMKIAETHGGTITLESEEGKGSEFKFLLNKI
ncbi:MAG: HAMP domain-containing histidine kinase [Lachnospiraceae bacterium]|nr:HAMP domain-containing histidine kinase [Lachnospiraceae bacterium]